ERPVAGVVELLLVLGELRAGRPGIGQQVQGPMVEQGGVDVDQVAGRNQLVLERRQRRANRAQGERVLGRLGVVLGGGRRREQQGRRASQGEAPGRCLRGGLVMGAHEQPHWSSSSLVADFFGWAAGRANVPGGRSSQWVSSRAATSWDGPLAAGFDSGSMSTPQRNTSRFWRSKRAVSV